MDNGNTIAQQYIINGSRKPKEYLKDVAKNLRDVLGISRGQMIYQEQIMQMVQIIAGYNLGHADTLRKIIGKKKIDEMPKLYDEFVYGHRYVINKFQKLLEEYDSMEKKYDKDQNEGIVIVSEYDGKDMFLTKSDIENTIKKKKKAMEAHEIKGAIACGYEKSFAASLFKQMAAFAAYAFNKSHSACYADESYQTAWLKVHYPVQFMTALLSVRGGDKDKTLENLKEAKRMGIRILRPDINESHMEFRPVKDSIRFGLLSIAGVGEKAVKRIIEDRDQNGVFKSFDDFISRLVDGFVKTDDYKSNPVQRNVIRKLIEAGCFDTFNTNRYELLNYYNFKVRGDKEWTGTLEDLEKDSAKKDHSYKYDISAFNDKLMLEMEYRLIGIYVSGSPYEDLPFTSLQDMDISRGRYNKTEYDVGGRITKIRQIKTKKGDPMAFVEIETQLEPLEFTVFPNVFKDYKDQLYKENIIVVRGYKEKSSYRGEEKEQFIASKVLVKQAKSLKKKMGIKSKKVVEEEVEVKSKEAPKPRPKRKDPVASLFDEKPKKKKKRKNLDLEQYV